jgi:peptidoglycan/xylan/chitin deacetylase (PgdA/CDA1 family)
MKVIVFLTCIAGMAFMLFQFGGNIVEQLGSPASAEDSYPGGEGYPVPTKQVALTFDDGPNLHTPEVIDIARFYDAKVTFFFMGNSAQEYPEIAQEAVAAGHSIGSHTITHPDLTKLDESAIRYEIGEGDRKVHEAAGVWPKWFRAPFGEHDGQTELVAQELGFKTITDWTLDSFDWKAKSADTLYERIINNVKDGDVVLLHEHGKYTVEILPRLMDELRKQGYAIVSLETLEGGE